MVKKSTDESVTPAEFARRLNISAAAISKLIKKGVLARSKNGKLNYYASIERMMEARDPRNDHKSSLKMRRAVAATIDEGTDEADTIHSARLKLEYYKAKKAEVDYLERIRELVPIQDVIQERYEAGRIVRDSILNVPERVTPLLLGETDEHKFREILENHLREALETLANEFLGRGYEQ